MQAHAFGTQQAKLLAASARGGAAEAAESKAAEKQNAKEAQVSTGRSDSGVVNTDYG